MICIVFHSYLYYNHCGTFNVSTYIRRKIAVKTQVISWQKSTLSTSSRLPIC